jgi:hypothetical protein
MTETAPDQLRFPTGKFTKPESLSAEQIADCIARLESFPERLKKEVAQLSDAQLDTPYRSEGWTIRQVVHHCADSHMNAIIRFKLALTEENAVIRPYPEALFAELPDSGSLPVDPALRILEGVHYKLGVLLRAMNAAQFSRSYIHPEYGTTYRLDQATALYAWHCDHHLAHITSLKLRKGWK